VGNVSEHRFPRERIANPGQPTISLGATGDAVKRLERALRRTPNPGLTVDGVFGPKVETRIKQYQRHCHSSLSIGAFWAISVRLPDPQIIDFVHPSRRTPGALDK
jgi:Putative peptidoglycan binding domain